MIEFKDLLESVTKTKYEKYARKVLENDECRRELQHVNLDDVKSAEAYVNKYFKENNIYKNNFSHKVKLLRRIQNDLMKNVTPTIEYHSIEY